MRYSAMNFDYASVQALRNQQMQALMTARSNFRYQNQGRQPQQYQQQAPTYQVPGYQVPSYQIPTYGGYGGGDRVTLGNQNWGGSGLEDPASIDRRMDQLFADPYAGTDMGYLKDALDQIAAAKQAYRPGTPTKKEAQKGELRVIAGDRSDGVKPKEVRVDDVNDYDTKKEENSYQDNRQVVRKEGKVGREYEVTVTWEDGSTTHKRVTLNSPNQTVYMDSSYSY